MQSRFDPYYRWLGIPPEDQPPNHYRLLGLRLFEADADVIETAADRQMRHVQTYKTGQHSAHSQILLNEIAAARLCLLSPTKKAAYDSQLQSTVASPPAASVPVAVSIANAAIEEAAPPVPLINTTSGSAGQLYRQKTQSSSALRWMTVAVTLLAVALFAAAAWFVWRAMPTAPQLPAIANQTLDEGRSLALEIAPADFEQRQGKIQFEILNGSPSGIQLDREQGSLVWVPDETHGPGTHKIGVRASVVGSPHLFDEATFDVVVAEVHQAPHLEPVELRPAGRGAMQTILRGKDPDVPRTRLEYSLKITPTPSVAPVLNSSSGQFGWRPGSEDLGKQFQLDFRVTKEGMPQLFSEQSLTVKLGETDSATEFGRDQFVAALKASGAAVEHVRQVDRALFGGQRHWYRIDQRVVDVTEFSDTAETKAILDRFQLQAARFGGVRLNSNVTTHFFHKGRLLVFYAGEDAALLDRLTAVMGQSIGLLRPNTATEPSPTPTETVTPTTTEPKKRLAPPEPAVLAKESDNLKETYKEQFKLRKPAEKLALAKTLYTDALKLDGNSSTLRFAMLQESSDLALVAGDLVAAWQALDVLTAQYEVNAFDLKLAALKKANLAGRNSIAEHYEAAQRYGELIELAVREERFEEAVGLIAPALGAAQRAKDNGLMQKVQKRRTELVELKKAFESAQAARSKLRDSPDDAAANMQLGSYLCFWRNKWNEGLRLIAMGATGKLAEAARADIAMPTDVKQRLATGDAWLEAAEVLRGMEKENAQARAEHWLRLALPQLTGLEKVQVEKRISSLPARSKQTSLADLAPEIETPPGPAAVPNQAGSSSPSTPVPPPQPDEVQADRQAAEQVLKLPMCAVTVQASQKTYQIRSGAALPNESFRLQRIELAGPAASDALLQALGELKHLNSLAILPGAAITDAGMKAVGRFPSLSQVRLEATQLSDATLVCLEQLPRLQFLQLAGGQYSGEGLATLAKLESLLGLSLTGVFKDEQVQQIRSLPQLQSLSVVSPEFTGAALGRFAEMARLRVLTLEGAALGDEHLPSLAQCKNVQNLSLRGQFSDAAWNVVAQMPSLVSLTLDSPHLTSAGIEPTSTLVNLKSLVLRGDGPVVTDGALAALARLPKLSDLSVMRGEQITDAGLVRLADMNSLETLNIYQARQIGGHGFESLAKLPRLKSVQLHDAVRVNDTTLMHFQSASRLEMLSVSGSRVTNEGLQALRDLLPKCTIRK